MEQSLDIRQDITVVEVPKLGKEAAMKAINEWGQPKSKSTHLVSCTTSSVEMPGVDYQLTKLLGLHSSVKHFFMYQQEPVLFILDEMRKESGDEGLKTIGEGLEWGVLFGFGPGLTVETVVLHSLCT
ncbi:hypothetical protein RHSIM_Rhsim09G0053500 [Rhododendron simsii]|uniref:Chalcone synthase n=1 Tax=Rhododendron simsii TaxID=118357 RepID=A0A834LE96_RHOSS|nr:hypothetical protein RHSIM_Rhsim09G0053500 [Rhododendron simsii]